MKRKSTDEFINESIVIHGNKYDYSLVKYKNNKTKVDIICNEHGIFCQYPFNHLKGHGCSKCSKNNKLTTDEFINKSIKVHGNKYDYSLVEYEGYNNKVNISCGKHGTFNQKPSDHLKGHGCPKCGGSKTLTNNKFINKSIKVHGNKYDYSLVEYKNNKTKVDIICKKHDFIFKQKPNDHLSGKGCPKCKLSKGEIVVENILIDKNIDYKIQYHFDKCRNKNTLPFDFYLPDKNMCIEYDGIQHFEPSEYFGGEKSFIQRKENDKIKSKYCIDNNIDLLRIKYNENILDILNKIL